MTSEVGSSKLFSELSQNSKVKDFLSGTTNKAVSAVAETAEKTKDTLTQTAREAVNKVTFTKNQAVDSVTETAEQAKSSIHEMVQRTDSFTGSITDAIQAELSNTIHNWVAEHPLINWALHHPLQILGMVLLVIFMLRGLFKLIDKLIVDAWVSAFKYLFQLSSLLLRGLKKDNSSKALSDLEKSLKLELPEQQVQLVEILPRLEVISQEQNQLLQKVTTILEANKSFKLPEKARCSTYKALKD